MPTTEQLRTRLLYKLKELFQLDQPDLDFGFYRVMHAKSKQVSDFLDNDLLKIVTDAFGEVDAGKRTELQAAYEKALEQAKEFGAPNPEESAPVLKAKAELDAVKISATAEGEVYDHLYRFFERYYDRGDFLSRRYYTRETAGKAAPYAIPYSGEEVKLVWANMDQYYIKTTEYFSNYTFDLRAGAQKQAELNKKNKTKDLPVFELDDVEGDTPLRVHFKIVDATEGEHGNVKAGDNTKRFFIIHKDEPVKLDDNGELVVQFEYRPDPEKTNKTQENSWLVKRNEEAVNVCMAELESLSEAVEYRRLLKYPAPTDQQKYRAILEKYIHQYTARNTSDYFIHKDLGGFLKRELDFYIKNEVMQLDDIENAEAPAVESYLTKLKVLRIIAGKIIEFLAQMEEFQKQLWLKKKFITETNYCITLDRIPEQFYPEIAANQAQHDEWVNLFEIDSILNDLATTGYKFPFPIDFLKENSTLVVDTSYFDRSFVEKLLNKIQEYDDFYDGILLHSENVQALNLLRYRYRNHIKTIYIDPPYNTGDDDFLYKDNYQESSWLTMLYERMMLSKDFLTIDGSFTSSIDLKEVHHAISLLDICFSPENRKSNITVKRGSVTGAKVRNPGPVNISENVLIYSCKEDKWDPQKAFRAKGYDTRYGTFLINPQDHYSEWEFTTVLDRFSELSNVSKSKLRKHYGDTYDKELLDFVIEHSDNVIRFAGLDENSISKEAVELKHESLRNPGTMFYLERPGVNDYFIRDGQVILFYRDRLKMVGETFVPADPISDIWDDVLPNDLHNEGGVSLRKGKKPEKLLLRILEATTKKSDIILDYFAGTGTSAAVAQKAGYKWINVEHGNYFDTKTIKRLKNTLYGEKSGVSKMTKWKGGGCIKYIRLETYEDALNNIEFDDNEARENALRDNPKLHEDYMLHYMLDVETQGSQSLLNIENFKDPRAYKLKVKKPNSDEYELKNVDLLETFNYLIGLRVQHIAAPQVFNANFKREEDPELPDDQQTRLVLDGRMTLDENGPWWFRKVEGWVPADPNHPNNGNREKVLIVWRTMTDDIEQDNLMLDEWFQKNRISTRDFEFDTIYVNGTNNLPNLRQEGDHWKVRLLEEEFMKRMWDVE